MLFILVFFLQNTQALTLDATFSSATDIPVTSSGYAAGGNSLAFTLGFHPDTGTTLTVVKNTGPAFIDGFFSNLSQGQEVQLNHDGKTYKFIANYFGGSGNDLVLQWAATRAVAFGNNEFGQLGNGSTASSSLQLAVNSTGVLAGKTVTAIAAGGRHSLALCSDGTVAAWGYNLYGQLGNNSTVNSSVPVAVNRSGVLAGKTVVAIAAGDRNSLALCSDGTLASWGHNSSGQLGKGDNFGWYLTPVAVDTSGVLYGKTVVAIAAGREHCLALCSDGTLAAWGYNYEGQLGNGQSAGTSLSPVAVDLSGVLSGKTITGIAAGEIHSMAICNDGSLAAWGANNSGQFGNGSSNYINPAPVAAGTTGTMAGKSAVAVACGSSHSIALCSDGTLTAWGYGSYGQLGNNSISNSDIPVAVNSSGALSGKTITALSAGKFFSLAMCSGGTMAAWGDNYNGQVGDNSTIQRRMPVAVTTATLAAGEKFLAGTSTSTAYHSLAIVAMPYISRIAVEQPAGMEWKSGRRTLDFGSCPAASSISKSFTLRNNGIVPLAITGFTLDGLDASDFAITTPPAASVEAGSTTTLTVTFTAGAGFNRSAVLHVASGDPNNPIFNLDLAATVARAFPIEYGTSSDVPVSAKSLTATGSSVSFNLAHAPATGTALTVVENTGLGFINGTFSNLSQGQEIALAYNGTTYRFVANYFGGTGNDLVLQWAATRLLAWGDNFGGQLGTGSLVDADRPTAVSTSGALGGKTILSTANGFGMSLAVCSDGTLASWGRNYAGQLGNSTTTDSNVPVTVNQTGVLAGKRVVAASVGYDHCVVLCSDGTLAAWGDGSDGKLGNGGYTDSSNPVAVNQPALSGKSVVAVSAGHSHNLALCSDGTVVSWGYPYSGLVNTLDVLNGKTVISISAGNSSSFALCSDGTPVTWGNNIWGQLGIGTFAYLPDNNPVEVYTAGALSGKTIAAIAAGFDHGLARCSDGSLSCWGDNSYGQLGNGTNNDSSEAVAVNQTGVLAGRTVVATAAGYQYNLARCSDGTLVTWGDGSDGKLGIGGFGSKTVPVIVQATALAAGEKIISATTAHYSTHSLATVALPAIPRIVLEQPAATGWASGRGCFDFGSAVPGSGLAKTFTVRNAGIEPLAIGGVWIEGANAADFTLTTPPASTVAAGASTTFTVTFNAATGIARAAVLHITSNDPYTNDFRLEMAGSVAGSFNMVYNTGAEILVSAPGFTATGSSISFSLGQPPATGTELTVIRNTGLGFISGTFENLTHGQVVNLEFGGISYQFVANYYGGSGNDLVLQWSPTRPFAWGYNASGQLGIGSTTNQTLPAAVTATGALAGKTIISVATGFFHSLALCSDGTVAAWGSNSSGQFGTGNTTSSNVPVVAGIGGALSGKRVVAIAAGSNFSLALCSDGTLAAWGSNAYGQLGNGTTTSSNVPVAVIDTEALSSKKIVAVATGSNYCLALCSDGTAASWGYNNYGQLGDDSFTDRYAPVAVSSSAALSDKTVTAITAGQYFSLALCSDGTVASWGNNDRGQLGDNSNVTRNVPVAVETSGALSGKEITAIAAGTSHTLASCSDGTLVTWGYNANGQLGIGNTTSSLVPVAVNMTGVLSGKTVVTLAAGSNHCLVRCSDGVTAVWGANSNGQLGDNTTSTRNVPVQVKTTSLAPGEKFIKASTAALSSHDIALVAVPYIPRLSLEQPASIGLTSGSSSVDFPSNAPNSATAKTFTVRNFGILPLAINSVAITGPQASEFVLTSPPATSLEPGASTTLTITFTSGAGFNRRAELHLSSNDPYFNDFGINLTSGGTGTLTATYTSSSAVPLVAPGFTATGSSVNFSLAYPPATGTTLMVVRNTGLGSIQGEFNSLTQGQEIVLVYGGKKYRYAANYFGGDGNDLVLQWADIRPMCWGRNTNGQLGIGSTTSSSLPVQVSMTGVLAGKTIMSMTAGGSHSLALCTDGTLAAWGLGTSGQLGTGSNTSSEVPVAVNAAGTLSGKRVIAIAAGLSHNLVLCSDGSVRTWGSNSSGQLGNGSFSTALNPVAVYASGVLSGKKVIAIAAGTNFSLALCSDGTLASWGSNFNGQLGAENIANSNVPVAVNQAGVLFGKTVVNVAAGSAHSLVLCSDGTIASWGSNSSRQLGNGSSLSSSIPVTVDTFLIQGGEIPIAIAAGGSHNLVLCSNGSLFAWGDNIYGQLGNDTSYQSGIPVPVNMAGVLSGKSITTAAAGSVHSMAFASDGTVSSWGWNSNGQLGDGTTLESTSPVAVNLGALSLGEHIIAAYCGPTASHVFTMVAAPAVNLTTAEAWRLTHFGGIANSGHAADDFDFDKDGVVNLLEYAFGLNPTLASSRQLPALQLADGNLSYAFNQPSGVSGITYIGEWSTTLENGSWNNIPNTGTPPQYIFSTPSEGKERLFIRLRVTNP